jgi:FxLD family lantipeptide
VPLEPVPAGQIRLNDLVVLPGRGELSPVIGVWPCVDRYARLLYVCTDNGDWTHRRADSPVLRADIRSPTRAAHPAARWADRQQVPVLDVLAPQGFHGQVEEEQSITDERITMSATLAAEATATPAAPLAAENPFALDVQIIIDVPAGHPLSACGEGTNDGCDPTCASACVSGGV